MVMFTVSSRSIPASLIPKAKIMLNAEEGYRRHPYMDSTGQRIGPNGKVTIGVGRNLTDNGLSPDEIEYLLINDIKTAWQSSEQLLGAHLWTLDDVRQLAILNMAFQLGYTKLSGFKVMLDCIRRRDWAGAAEAALFSKWAKEDCPARAERVVGMLKTGKWAYGQG